MTILSIAILIRIILSIAILSRITLRITTLKRVIKILYQDIVSFLLSVAFLKC